MGVTANFSAERREHALGMIRSANRQGMSGLDYNSRLAYAVGTLICDETGFFTHDAIVSALKDASIVQAARELLRKAATA